MKAKILSWIEENKKKLKLGTSYTYKDMSTGESNFVFRVTGKKEVIIRANKKAENSLITREAKILKFLQNHNIRAPKLLLFDPKSIHGELISAQEYVGKKDLNTKSMTKTQINSLADLLASLHSIKVKDYNSYFKENQKSSFTRYELYKTLASGGHSDFKKVKSQNKEELKTILKEQNQHIKKYKNDKTPLPLTLNHKDPHGDNLRVNDDVVYLIDWEDAGIHYGLCDVVQFLGFSKLPAKFHKLFKTRYEKKTKYKIDTVIFNTIHYIMLVNGLCWNAKMIELRKTSKKYQQNYIKYLNKFKQISKLLGL